MNGKIIKILLAAVLMSFGAWQVAAQVCTPAPVGLVSAWSGDGDALDARSRSNGTLQGNVAYAAGKVGQAFNLPGNGETVVIGNPANLRLQEFTIEAWVKRSSSSVVTNNPDAFNPGGIFFAYGQNGYAFIIDQPTGRLGLSSVGNSGVFSPNFTITDTNWHHVAVTRVGSPLIAGGQTIFYLDGAADTPMSYAPQFGFTSNAGIGARPDVGSNAFFGAIDELAIYNRPLAASEIQSIFNSGTSGKCKPVATTAPDNQVLWLAGDGDALDSSGNGNNGTLQSGSVF
ncbi:MAG TPA: LamG domain-containing protein, partial [Pyrinomonadaceae bacterium]|nr:LamG domain-containing protein [Pyrinomonadaceae bacterium]